MIFRDDVRLSTNAESPSSWSYQAERQPFRASVTAVIMPARSSLPALSRTRRRSGPDLQRVAFLRCNDLVMYELGHEKTAFLCRVRKKAQKNVKPSFCHTGTKNKEKKKRRQRRCTVKKGIKF